MNARGIVIVGAGEAGARAALALREEGFAGAVTLIGAETFPPYERPPLSKAALTSVEEPSPPAIAGAAALDERDIAYLSGVRIVAIDRGAHAIVAGDGRRFRYDRLCLATGALPRRLTVGDRDACLVLRSYDDAQALRRRFVAGARIAIVGGGFIGLELAASAVSRGCAATILEAAPRIMTRGVPAEIAEIVARRHQRAGVELIVGVRIASIERNAKGAAILLQDGRRIEADAVVAGVGAAPDTALAASCGLAIDNGVAVDGALRASDPDIFAIGDCASFPHPLYGGRRIRLEAWRNAQHQGAFVARSMLGEVAPYAAVPWFWSDQYDLSLQIAGLVDEGRTSARRDLGDGALMLFHLAEDRRLVAASAAGPLGKIAREVRLAEMLIARRATPDPATLASPDVKLKSLLAA
ncbi:MAG: FAD-dependent oxidoreductase [Roseiarcus sp.]|jgi:3-phenylpropionate/trans-cinnamate dioxygenase ferredoxin reductase subunit